MINQKEWHFRHSFAHMTLSTRELEQKIEQAFHQTALQFNAELTKVISEPGAFPGYDGDLVDTGAFRASQLVLFPTTLLAEYIWGVNYAVFLHEGFTKKNGQKTLGRPWTWVCLRRFNWEQRFSENLKRIL